MNFLIRYIAPIALITLLTYSYQNGIIEDILDNIESRIEDSESYDSDDYDDSDYAYDDYDTESDW
jgi:hypothetical protein